MPLQSDDAHPVERCANGDELRNDLVSVAPLLNHALQTAYLPLNTAQAHEDVFQLVCV
jgi:hypothetical protein